MRSRSLTIDIIRGHVCAVLFSYTQQKISALQSEISFQTGDDAIFEHCRRTYGNGVVATHD
jgi:hypothetical protein